MLRLLALSLVLVGTSATAQVYRCKLPSGQMSYSNQPCADQNAGGLVSERRSQEDLMQERERADEAQFRKETRRSMQEPQTITAPATRVASSGPAVNQWACRKARDNYRTTAGGAFRNALEQAKALQEEEQRVNKACGTSSNVYADPQAIALEEKQRKDRRRSEIANSMPDEPIKHTEIQRCSGQYCYDNYGKSYHSIGNGQIRSHDGATCTMSGGKHSCR